MFLVFLHMLELCSLYIRLAICFIFFHIGMKKHTFYSNDIKFNIYAELLTRTDPPVLRCGVNREVANKFDVPMRTVQDIWHKGQSDGLQAIKNKLAGVVDRKRI
jgi:hypothetical protein